MRRLSSAPAAIVLAIATSIGFCPRGGFAATMPSLSIDALAQAWMGAVTLLADEGGEREPGNRRDRGDRCECGKGDCEACRGGHAHRGHRGHGPRPGMEGPRAALAKMDDIVARLARIEAKLDGRPVRESRGDWHGPRPEMPAEAREQMRKRMEEGREKMEQARRRFAEMEERIKKLEAEVERLRADR